MAVRNVRRRATQPLANKSLLTSLLAALTVIAGYLTPVYRDQILSVGFFALSGAVTNWLAIHMLFEKVPFLYGSGVIPARFEEFKTAIKSIIMRQFFTQENLDRFFEAERDAILSKIDFDEVAGALDYDEIFRAFVDVVWQSPVGAMLGIVGGKSILYPMKEPFSAVIRSVIIEVTRSEPFLEALEQNIVPPQMSVEVKDKVEEIVDQRLEELTPQMVKRLVQDMIREHLGWLVVWGGVFGGVIGLLTSFLA